MAISGTIREVFGRFQNLNLLALLAALRDDSTAQQDWSSGTQLCPVAHGLASGGQVRQLNVLGQAAALEYGCACAARSLGADPAAVLRFVRSWDADTFGRGWLLRQLEELWAERLADAAVVQELLRAQSPLAVESPVSASDCC